MPKNGQLQFWCLRVEWGEDYKPFSARPFGDRQVWVGYDPAETGSNAGLIVVAPQVPCGKFVTSFGVWILRRRPRPFAR